MNAITDSDIKYYALAGVAVILVALLAGLLIYTSVSNSLASLRVLNDKMNDIMSQKTLEDLKVSEDLKSSREITRLYDLFSDLISNKRFTTNNFFEMPDAFAVIELAQSC